jgi:hypothetical protein
VDLALVALAPVVVLAGLGIRYWTTAAKVISTIPYRGLTYG